MEKNNEKSTEYQHVIIRGYENENGDFVSPNGVVQKERNEELENYQNFVIRKDK